MGEFMHYEPGTALYSIAAGEVKPWLRKSRKAVDIISKQDGFMGVNLQWVPTHGNVSLWFFETEQDAIRARNMGKAYGIEFGSNVSRWVVASDGVPEFDSEWAKRKGQAC